MYAIAFDLLVVETARHHPKGVTQAYTEIGAVLGEHGFRRVQGSLYVTDDENMANLFLAIQALRPGRGSRKRFEISVLSASSNGPTSRLWRRAENPGCS